MIDAQEITGIILCGGRAERMGGVEKPLQPLAGHPLVWHVHERLSAQVSAVIISANRHQADYEALAPVVVGDVTRDRGPLGGLDAALRVITTPWAFVCPGDAPYLDRDLVRRLSAAVGGADMVFPHDGQQEQPLFLLVRTSLDRALATYLERGQRSVHGFAHQHGAVCVSATDIAPSFLNINTLDDLKAASAASADYNMGR